MTSPLAAFHRANLLTYASLASAGGALVAAGSRHAAAAGALIALAVIFDTFDGKFARLFTRTESERAIGVQLDSLSDAIAFGLVPPVTVALLVGSTSAAATAAGFAYAASAITRLAFYNVSHEQHDGFIGLPVPVAALIWATTLLLEPAASIFIGVAAATALAMVFPIPIPRPRGAAMAAFVCWPLTLIVAFLS